jgi:hypothetical protein
VAKPGARNRARGRGDGHVRAREGTRRSPPPGAESCLASAGIDFFFPPLPGGSGCLPGGGGGGGGGGRGEKRRGEGLKKRGGGGRRRPSFLNGAGVVATYESPIQHGWPRTVSILRDTAAILVSIILILE